jgi:hypothetical protein
MTRWLVLLAMVGGCASQRQVARTPRCSVPECCIGGWVFNGLACQPNAPPFCGCFCDTSPPEVFETERACAAAHRDRGLFRAGSGPDAGSEASATGP